MDDAAAPEDVVVPMGERVPKVLVKVTTVPLFTMLPNRSVTMARSELVLPTTREVGLADSAIVDGAPAVNVTAAVPVMLPFPMLRLPVIGLPISVTVPAAQVPRAWPFAFVATGMLTLPRVPGDVLPLSETLGTRLLY